MATDLPEPDFDNLEILLIDEKSVRKGHGYVTVVLNGITGELLHMAEGKKKESLESFFCMLSDKQKTSVLRRLYRPQRSLSPVLREQLPGAEVVHDRFHVIANLNAALDEVRRSEWRAACADGKRVIKGSRFLLAAASENLDSNGFARLSELSALNSNISKAYILKEEFRHIYAVATSPRSGAARIKRWCELVEVSGIAPLLHFAGESCGTSPRSPLSSGTGSRQAASRASTTRSQDSSTGPAG